jgi:putative nucleotidyltransferase with HDIG domain
VISGFLPKPMFRKISKKPKKKSLTSNSKHEDKKENLLFNYLYKGVMILSIIVVITILYPLESMYIPPELPREGEMSQEDIVAPFTFYILKSSDELEKDKKIALSELSGVLNLHPTVLDTVLASVESFFLNADSLRSNTQNFKFRKEKIGLAFPHLSSETVELLSQSKSLQELRESLPGILKKLYSSRIIPNFQNLPEVNSFSILTPDSIEEILTTREKLLTLSEAKKTFLSLAHEKFKQKGVYAKATFEIGGNFLKPNLTVDRKETEKRREDILASIPEYKGEVKKGERIIGKNEIVTQKHLQKLSSLATYRVRWSFKANRWDFVLLILSRSIFIISVIMLLVIFLFLFKKEILKDNSKLLLITLLILVEVILAYFIGFRWHLTEYLIPVTLTSLLLTILLGVESGLIVTFALSILLGMINNFNFNLMLISIVVGGVAAYSVKEVTQRYKFYRPMLYVCFSYVVMIYLMESLKFSPTSETLEYCGFGVLNGFISTILTMGLLPVFESIFGITTDITLLELSDLNHPLLKRLTLVAPGTYHHSIVVGNLAEAAAKALGANTLLARVGAYYHDIGKMEKAEYFVENQMGFKNKHEKLTPTMSALILESHVKEGVEMAKEMKLPKSIVDIIKEHHGTTVMSYFYNKAIEQGATNESIDEFRYSGPKPKSKEAGILMLADAVEAASRVLEEPKPARIRGLIKKVIMDKFESGELDDCDLTLRELHAIEESFLPILIGVFHLRIDYPELVEET